MYAIHNTLKYVYYTPVSYTHLDVYKRQGIHRRKEQKTNVTTTN